MLCNNGMHTALDSPRIEWQSACDSSTYNSNVFVGAPNMCYETRTILK